jgi:hypothetical protein
MFAFNNIRGVSMMRASIGNIEQKYSKRGTIYRLGKKPSYVLYYSHGSIYMNHWFNSKSFLHRHGSPAMLWYTKSNKLKWLLWYTNGISFSEFFNKNI